MDMDMPDSASETLLAIGAAANRARSTLDDTPGSEPIDADIVAILAGEPFTEEAAAEKLVRDALYH
jgi:hypothetical protein